jgi:histidinol dehydrogenase
MLLGPSESLVVADDSADVRLLAADLLIEAEHGDDSATLLVTPSRDLVTAVDEEITRQIAELPEPRRSYAAASLGRNGGAVIVESVAEAIEVANLYAPEHMQLVVADEDSALSAVEHAGEVLLGQHTPFSLANYVVGIPAALPTGRFARVTEGITAKTFMKNVSIARASEQALTELGPSVIALADHEDFPAHAAAIRLRLEGTPDQ